jgi:single-strand DNA-binding protein
MSVGLNRVFLLGHVGKRPQIRTTGTGARVATFSVATDRGWRAKGDQEKTDWHRVVVWDLLAEQAAKTLDKGDRVFVEGRIEYRSYEDASGRSRVVTEIVADDLIVFDSRAGGAEHPTSWKERFVS